MVAKVVEQLTPKQAFDTVMSALEPLNADVRRRVLASVTSFLGMDAIPEPDMTPRPDHKLGETAIQLPDLVRTKQAVTITQKIALFAYFREKLEGRHRFSRDDLKMYFEKAKELPPGNYDRDFMKTVELGWIHENGADSYLTSKGLEAVEAGFGGKQPPRRGRPVRKPKKSKGRIARK